MAVELSLPLSVVPVLIGIGPVLLAILPAIVVALFALLVSLFRPSTWKSLALLTWGLKLQVALAAAVIGGAWLLAGWLVPDSTSRVGSAGKAEAGRDWPCFRGNLARTGHVPGSPAPSAGSIRWSWREDGEAYLSSPAVVGNRVYFTSAEPQVFGRGEGKITCLDADSGDLVWQVRPPRYDATFSSPSIQGEYLVVGEGLHTTTDARVFCLSLAPGREGEILWTFQTQSHVESTPLIHQDKVLIGAGDRGGYYCLALAGDGNGGPKVLWHRVGPDFLDAETSLAAADGVFYVGLGNEGKALVALDAETGAERGRIQMDYPVFSSPAIADGKLYVGSGNGDMAYRAEDLSLPPGGQVVCVDLDRFRIDWQVELPRTVLGAVAVADGRVFAACRDGSCYVFSTEGRQLDVYQTHSEILSSPAVADGRVYLVSRSGVCQAFDVRTGRNVWECSIGNAAPADQFGYLSSPAVARGHVYVGTPAGGLVCAGLPGRRARPIWPSSRGGAHQGAWNSAWLVPAAEWKDNFPVSEDAPTDSPAVQAGCALIGPDILVPLSHQAGKGNGLACLRVEAGRFQRRWHLSTGLGVISAPAAIGTPEGLLDRAVVLDGREGQDGRKLYCLDGEGQLLWTRPAGPDASRWFCLTADRIFAQLDGPDELTCVGIDGVDRWTAPAARLTGPPLADGNFLLLPVAGSDAPAVLVLDRVTGQRLKRIALPAGRILDLHLQAGRVRILTDKGLTTVDLAGPTEVQAPAAKGPAAATAGTFSAQAVWYVSAQGQLVRRSLDEDKTQTFGPASPVAAPLRVGSSVLSFDPEGNLQLVTVDERTGQLSEPVSWLGQAGSSWLGQASTPIHASGSHVLIGMRGWGLCLFGGAR